ncbi:TetR/AcrR family transcriptional regulator [Halobacillus sp. Cin3]|uniref:TetR/AcrR family transcriptional regulator n=1 Tax=Halobacillus sp. Cin3 TaxID=2928441 RepID=UPI00248D7199|nr:TetR/AcrR family transcriptional regulator [Halobacillus sp. Cin3]
MTKGEETKKRIVNNALITFATNGYEETSMKDIATRTNIKAPSIYAYFSSKDRLFEEVMDTTMLEYIHYIQNIDNDLADLTTEAKLYNILIGLNEYFYNNSLGHFIKRFMIIPPKDFKDKFNTMYFEMEKAIKSLVNRVLNEGREENNKFVNIDVIANSFLCILDGALMYLMNFSYEEYRRRLDDTWITFWNGIQK